MSWLSGPREPWGSKKLCDQYMAVSYLGINLQVLVGVFTLHILSLGPPLAIFFCVGKWELEYSCSFASFWCLNVLRAYMNMNESSFYKHLKANIMQLDLSNIFSSDMDILNLSNAGGNLTGVSRDATDLSSSSSNSKFSSTSISRSEDEILQSSNLKSFSFSELKLATRNFRPDSLLGEGGFGSVYKGWIDEHSSSAAKPGSGTVVAVKKLNLDSLQGHKEWLAEVNFLGQLHHAHLVRLIGYCLEDEHRLLVYEFLSRGSMENHLFRRGLYFQPLSWSLRLKIALGAAEGLAFLHNDENKVIYRDFKASNILLDTNYTAKLSDFGLAKDGPTGDKSHVSTRIMGTYGYAAPEYLATGHLSAKSDVYSFGVVLVEILSGRRAIDKNRPPGEQNLVEWAKPFLPNKRKTFRLLDARMERNYSMESASRVAILASRCLSTEPKFRPSMVEIVTTLKDLQSKGTVAAGNRRSRTCRETSDTGNAHKEVSAYPRPSASALFT